MVISFVTWSIEPWASVENHIRTSSLMTCWKSAVQRRTKCIRSEDTHRFSGCLHRRLV